MHQARSSWQLPTAAEPTPTTPTATPEEEVDHLFESLPADMFLVMVNYDEDILFFNIYIYIALGWCGVERDREGRRA